MGDVTASLLPSAACQLIYCFPEDALGAVLPALGQRCVQVPSLRRTDHHRHPHLHRLWGSRNLLFFKHHQYSCAAFVFPVWFLWGFLISWQEKCALAGTQSFGYGKDKTHFPSAGISFFHFFQSFLLIWVLMRKIVCQMNSDMLLLYFLMFCFNPAFTQILYAASAPRWCVWPPRARMCTDHSSRAHRRWVSMKSGTVGVPEVIDRTSKECRDHLTVWSDTNTQCVV